MGQAQTGAKIRLYSFALTVPHDGVTALSSRGQNRIVEASGHFIQFENRKH